MRNLLHVFFKQFVAYMTKVHYRTVINIFVGVYVTIPLWLEVVSFWIDLAAVLLEICLTFFVQAVSKAFKTLENDEGYKRCQEIVEEARNIVNENVSSGTILVLHRH